MPFVLLILALAWAFVWNLIVAGVSLIIFNVIGIPALDALTFWQVFGLALVISLATLNVGGSSN